MSDRLTDSLTAAMDDASRRAEHPSTSQPRSALIGADGLYRITPSEVTIKGHLWDAFDHSETEVSAAYVVRFCQVENAWRPFAYEQIDAFYQACRKSRGEHFTFNRLIKPGVSYGSRGRSWTGGGWIVVRDGLHHITEEFVQRCHASATRRSEP